MSLYHSIFASVFPWADDGSSNSFDTSNLTGWNGSSVFSPNGQLNGESQQPDNPPPWSLSQMRQNEPIPTTTNDVSSLTPQAQPATTPNFNIPPVIPDNTQAPDVSTRPPVFDPQAEQSAQTAGWGSSVGAPDNSGTDQYGKKLKTVAPPLQLPYAADDTDPIHQQQNKIAQLKYQVENPTKASGLKGRLLEITKDFLYGLSQAPDHASVGQVLATGAIGGGLGAVNPAWSSRREAEAELPKAQQGLQTAINQAHTQAQTTGILQKPAIEQAKQDALTKRAQARDIVRQYNALREFDPDDPENAEFVRTAKEAGLVLPKKDAKTSYKYITNAKTGRTYVDVSDQAGNRHLEEVTNADGTPLEIDTPQMITSADKKEQRELQERLAKQGNITKIKVAEIGAKKSVDVANINQAGATGRNNDNIKSKEQIAQEKLDATTQYHKDVQRLGQTKAEASHLASFIRTYMQLHGQEPSSELQDQFLEGLRGAINPTPVTKAQDTANTVKNAIPSNLRP